MLFERVTQTTRFHVIPFSVSTFLSPYTILEIGKYIISLECMLNSAQYWIIYKIFQILSEIASHVYEYSFEVNFNRFKPWCYLKIAEFFSFFVLIMFATNHLIFHRQLTLLKNVYSIFSKDRKQIIIMTAKWKCTNLAREIKVIKRFKQSRSNRIIIQKSFISAINQDFSCKFIYIQRTNYQ